MPTAGKQRDGIGVYIDPKEIQKRKDELKRGQSKAFKHALGEIIHYWRDTYAPRHFTKGAYQRYGHPKSSYGHDEAKSSSSGATITQGGYTLNPPYTVKEVMQTGQKYEPQNKPMVFSGRTREGILQGSFTARGSAKKVKGSWNDQKINWRALSANNRKLARHLIKTPPGEQQKMLNLLDRTIFPKWLRKHERGEQIPGRLRMTRTGGGGSFSLG